MIHSSLLISLLMPMILIVLSTQRGLPISGDSLCTCSHTTELKAVRDRMCRLQSSMLSLLRKNWWQPERFIGFVCPQLVLIKSLHINLDMWDVLCLTRSWYWGHWLVCVFYLLQLLFTLSSFQSVVANRLHHRLWLAAFEERGVPSLICGLLWHRLVRVTSHLDLF